MRQKSDKEILKDILNLNLAPIPNEDQEFSDDLKDRRNQDEQYFSSDDKSRRFEDSFPNCPPKIKRRIVLYSISQGSRLFSIFQFFQALLSVFSKGYTPYVSKFFQRNYLPSLKKRHKSSGESIGKNLKRLSIASQSLLGINFPRGSVQIQKQIQRDTNPFALAVLSLFSQLDRDFMYNLAFLGESTDKNTHLPMAALGRLAQGLYRLMYMISKVTPGELTILLNQCSSNCHRTIKKSTGLPPDERRHALEQIDIHRFVIEQMISRLRETTAQLYPVLLYSIGEFYEWEDNSSAKRNMILKFLNLHENDLLDAESFWKEHHEEKKRQEQEQQLKQLQAIEEKEQQQLDYQFPEAFELLDILFPELDFYNLEYDFLLPKAAQLFPNSLINRDESRLLSSQDPLSFILLLNEIMVIYLNTMNSINISKILQINQFHKEMSDLKNKNTRTLNQLCHQYFEYLDFIRKRTLSPIEKKKFILQYEMSTERKLGELRQALVQKPITPQSNLIRKLRTEGHGIEKTYRGTNLFPIVKKITGLMIDSEAEFRRKIATEERTHLEELLRKSPFFNIKRHKGQWSSILSKRINTYFQIKFKEHRDKTVIDETLLLFHLGVQILNLYQFLLSDKQSFLINRSYTTRIAGSYEKAIWIKQENTLNRNSPQMEEERIRYQDPKTLLLTNQRIEAITRNQLSNCEETFCLCLIKSASQMITPEQEEKEEGLISISAVIIKRLLDSNESAGAVKDGMFLISFQRSLANALIGATRMIKKINNTKVSMTNTHPTTQGALIQIEKQNEFENVIEQLYAGIDQLEESSTETLVFKPDSQEKTPFSHYNEYLDQLHKD